MSRARARSDGPPHRGARAERQLNGSASSGKALSRIKSRGRERSTSKFVRFGPSSVRMSEGLHSLGLAGEPRASPSARGGRLDWLTASHGHAVLAFYHHDRTHPRTSLKLQVKYSTVCATRGAALDT